MGLAGVLAFALAAAAPLERAAILVHAADSPVRLERAAVLTPSAGPPVLVYAATNQTAEELEQFTVIAFVFDAKGTLKARQIAPGRRTLEPKETKYSTLVLDGSPIAETDIIVVGVNQAQRAGSDDWWRSDIQPAAVAAAKNR
jgi:hypothetical protein